MNLRKMIINYNVEGFFIFARLPISIWNEKLGCERMAKDLFNWIKFVQSLFWMVDRKKTSLSVCWLADSTRFPPRDKKKSRVRKRRLSSSRTQKGKLFSAGKLSHR